MISLKPFIEKKKTQVIPDFFGDFLEFFLRF